MIVTRISKLRYTSVYLYVHKIMKICKLRYNSTIVTRISLVFNRFPSADWWRKIHEFYDDTN